MVVIKIIFWVIRSCKNMFLYVLCETFSNKKVVLKTQQPKNLNKMLVTAKFDLYPELRNRKPNRLFSCTDCIYHKNGYIKPNHTNHLPLNLQMGNLLLGTIINFLIAIVKTFYIS